MSTASLAKLRSRPNEAYATQHAGYRGDDADALVYRRVICPLLPPPSAGLVVDLGCGRGDLQRGHVATQNLTFAARKGAVTVTPAES